MAKIWIMSDMHCESGEPAIAAGSHRPADVDLVIIAGDFHRAAEAVQHARQSFPKLPIVMIAGNHEHDQSRMTIDAGLDLMRVAAKAGWDGASAKTHVLENETVELSLAGENIRIIGATLWTDFRLFRNFQKHSNFAESNMPDYVMIRGSNEDLLTPYETALRHSESRAYIRDGLQRPFAGKTIVVTHHLPSIRSIPQRYKTDPLTPAFASDCSDLLALDADLWVHGHTRQLRLFSRTNSHRLQPAWLPHLDRLHITI